MPQPEAEQPNRDIQGSKKELLNIEKPQTWFNEQISRIARIAPVLAGLFLGCAEHEEPKKLKIMKSEMSLPVDIKPREKVEEKWLRNPKIAQSVLTREYAIGTEAQIKELEMKIIKYHPSNADDIMRTAKYNSENPKKVSKEFEELVRKYKQSPESFNKSDFFSLFIETNKQILEAMEAESAINFEIGKERMLDRQPYQINVVDTDPLPPEQIRYQQKNLENADQTDKPQKE